MPYERHFPLCVPTTARFPSDAYMHDVTISPTSTQSTTFKSGMFHIRNFPSSEPEIKNLSFTGLKQIEVTKSWCVKIRKHSDIVVYHNRTVLSMELERSQSVCDQHKSSISPRCPAYSWMGFSSKSFSPRPAVVPKLFHTLTTLSCPAAAKYVPFMLNDIVQIVPSCERSV